MQDETIQLSVKLGGINWLYLALEFTTGKLIKAHFGGQDNPWDAPKDGLHGAAEHALAADSLVRGFFG